MGNNTSSKGVSAEKGVVARGGLPYEAEDDTDSDMYYESESETSDGERGGHGCCSGHRQDPPPTPASHAKLTERTWYQKAKSAYDSLVLAIIRPPRSVYDIADLGPDKFNFCGRVYCRRDFTLKNEKGQKLCCSIWEPFEIERKARELPCVIYMHGNSSNRREAISQLSLVLSLGVTLCTLDFSGSGKSDGEYVSLGCHEKDDLQTLIRHLRDSGTTSKIALWGRSMGAATALLHARRDATLACMICDSSFSSLVALAENMVEMGRKQGLFAPGFVISLAIRFIRSSVLEQAGFDIYDLNPAEEAEHSIIPLLLIAAEGDAFIPPSHSQLVYYNYAGPKHAFVVPGDHNSIRPKKILDNVAIFLANALQIPDENIMPEGLHCIGQPPWLQQQQVDQSQVFSPASVKQLSSSHTHDISVGMNKAQQEGTKDKLFNLIGGGSRG